MVSACEFIGLWKQPPVPPPQSPSYEELLEQNEQLRKDNRELGEQLSHRIKVSDPLFRENSRLESHLEACKRRLKIIDDFVELFRPESESEGNWND